MKKNIAMLLAVLSGLFLVISGLPAQDSPPNFDEAYARLREAYQAREAGRDKLSQEKLGTAFAMFKDIASRRGPKIVKSSSDFRVEEDGREVKLFENRSLFKIEI